MDIKVNNARSVKKASKSKSAGTSSADGASFASALDQAIGTNQTSETQQAVNVEAVNNFVFEESGNVPTQAKQRGYYILDLLEELEQDILTGKETKVASKLQEALDVNALDFDSLPAAVKELMDEIDARAQIELEKLKL